MKNLRIEIKWALIFAALTLLWMVLEKAVGLHDRYIDKHLVYTNFFAIPAIAVFVFALLDKKKNYYHGIMNYRQGLICGLIISVMVMVLSPVTQWITSVVITPEYFPNVIEYSLKTGYHQTREEAEAYFSLKNYIIQGLFGSVAMGAVTSAIVALFVKSKQPAT